jgi:hypothetical protein
MKPLRWFGQLIAYGAFATFVGYFAAAPAWQAADAEKAEIKFSLTHAGARLEECRRYTPEELAKIAPNMRRTLDCKRERVPVEVELEVDGQSLLRASLPPTGLWKDGPSVLYRRFALAPGPHRVTVRLRDDLPGRGDAKRWQGEWTAVRSADITLAPRQNFTIDYRADLGGFLLHAGGGGT